MTDATTVSLSSVFPDPSKQESLECEVEPDPMEGEQTWPTEEELAQAEGKRINFGFDEMLNTFCEIIYFCGK